MQNRNCIIFGATGQDGSLLCKSLIKQGYKVFGISRRNIESCPNHIKLGISKNVNFYPINISNISEIEELIKNINPIEIYNLSAQSSVGKSFSNPKDTFESIVTLTLNLLEASKSLNYQGRILFAGSSEMYGDHSSRINIESDKKPINPYGIAKLCSYNLVKMYREINNIRCATAILFNHESQFRHKDFVTHKVIEAAIKCNKDPRLKIKLGNLNIFRDWGWAEEYIQALETINRSKNIKDYLVCTGMKMQLKKFVEIAFLEKGLDWQEHVILDKSLIRPTDCHQIFGNPEELKAELKWEASTKGKELIKTLMKEKESINSGSKE